MGFGAGLDGYGKNRFYWIRSLDLLALSEIKMMCSSLIHCFFFYNGNYIYNCFYFSLEELLESVTGAASQFEAVYRHHRMIGLEEYVAACLHLLSQIIRQETEEIYGKAQNACLWAEISRIRSRNSNHSKAIFAFSS